VIADAPVPLDLVAIEREVDFLDAVLLGAGAKGRFRARRTSAEENAVGWLHPEIIA
jgi:hypothetical protein